MKFEPITIPAKSLYKRLDNSSFAIILGGITVLLFIAAVITWINATFGEIVSVARSGKS